jgi:hypothetical protein
MIFTTVEIGNSAQNWLSENNHIAQFKLVIMLHILLEE